MPRDASELARRLAREAEAVCRQYLSNGRREGRYWLVGDVQNTPGRSLFVRLYKSPKGPAGKWTDAATGEHGDLLDIIRERLALRDFRDVANEARRFLNLPRSNPEPPPNPVRPAVRRGSREAARRLFAISRPIEGTLAEHISAAPWNCGRAPWRQSASSAALLLSGLTTNAADGDLAGDDRLRHRCRWQITGVHRTWLDPEGFGPNRLGKAPIDTPRRAMGDLLGNAVRFGVADDVLVAGEGLETMLSLRCVLPTMPMAAALSASHLAALLTSRRRCDGSTSPAMRMRPDGAVAALDVARRRSRHRGLRPVAQARRLQRRFARVRPGGTSSSGRYTARATGRRSLPSLRPRRG